MSFSLEDLIKAKSKEKEATRKPRFISKADRIKSASQSSGAVSKTTKFDLARRHEGLNQKPPDPAKKVSRPLQNQEKKDQPVAKKDKKEKFLFEWKETENTLDENDDLRSLALKKPDQREIQAATGGGLEQRLRRQKELEKLKQEQTAQTADWDEVGWRDKPVSAMKERDWRIFREDFNIQVKGNGKLPLPMRFWKESRIPKAILDIVDELGYKEPTPIQRAAIPIALSTRDVIGIAETGSGKTASFVIPLLTYILELASITEETKTDGPYAVILAPTRELAQQIEREAQRFCTPLNFRCVSIVGGHTVEEQSYRLSLGAEIVVATPGRLLDCLERHVLVLKQCCYLVMDEADRMVDFGFEESVTGILGSMPQGAVVVPSAIEQESKRTKNRITMMYTATWPKDIQQIAEKYLKSPVTIRIGNQGQATDLVEQRVEFIEDEGARKRRLLQLLGQFAPPVIVFANTKNTCNMLAKSLESYGERCALMHGSKTQDQREAALAQLKSGEAHFLVATDVAGRGIDVPDVSLVVNFQMTRSIEDYTHRIGRTGRAGRKGTAITFLGRDDEDVLHDLKCMIQRSAVSRVPDELRYHEAAKAKLTL